MSRRSDRTRAAILQSARTRFAATGYQGTTIRAVASDAGVDPAMVMRYYGNKDGLFNEATRFDLALPDLTAVARANLGAAAVDHFLRRWEQVPNSDGLRVLLATAATDPAAAKKMHSIFASQLAPVVRAATVSEHGEGADSAARAGLIATQMLGLALCRYILLLPPVVHLDRAALVHSVGPVIQHYLTDDLTTG